MKRKASVAGRRLLKGFCIKAGLPRQMPHVEAAEQPLKTTAAKIQVVLLLLHTPIIKYSAWQAGLMQRHYEFQVGNASDLKGCFYKQRCSTEGVHV